MPLLLIPFGWLAAKMGLTLSITGIAGAAALSSWSLTTVAGTILVSAGTFVKISLITGAGAFLSATSFFSGLF